MRLGRVPDEGDRYLVAWEQEPGLILYTSLSIPRACPQGVPACLGGGLDRMAGQAVCNVEQALNGMNPVAPPVGCGEGGDARSLVDSQLAGLCSSHGQGGVLQCGYEFLIGDDLKGLGSSNGHQFVLSLVDLASNAAMLVPLVGEGARAGVLTLRGLFSGGEHEAADALVKDFVSRDEGARLTEDGSQVGCALSTPARVECFPAGTLVATPKGERAIERLQAGDLVLAEDPASGKVEPERVQALITRPRSALIALDLSDGSSITVQPDHAFWVDGGTKLARGGWMLAGQLKAGDRLRTASGEEVAVVRVGWNVGSAVVYTLSVAKDHTFFVGTARVLVHNADPGACVIVIGARSGQADSLLARVFGTGSDILSKNQVKILGLDYSFAADELRSTVGEYFQRIYHLTPGQTQRYVDDMLSYAVSRKNGQYVVAINDLQELVDRGVIRVPTEANVVGLSDMTPGQFVKVIQDAVRQNAGSMTFLNDLVYVPRGRHAEGIIHDFLDTQQGRIEIIGVGNSTGPCTGTTLGPVPDRGCVGEFLNRFPAGRPRGPVAVLFWIGRQG